MHKIILVESLEPVKLLYGNELELCGYHVRIISNDASVLRHIEHEKPDLVVLGRKLESPDEKRIFANIRSRFPKLPVLIYMKNHDALLETSHEEYDYLVARFSNFHEMKIKINMFFEYCSMFSVRQLDSVPVS